MYVATIQATFVIASLSCKEQGQTFHRSEMIGNLGKKQADNQKIRQIKNLKFLSKQSETN